MVVKCSELLPVTCFLQTGANMLKVVSAFSRQVLWTRAAALLYETRGLVFLQ
jgi:hypothetical protein